ncbi:alcohol dehydrogenase catalytic domain-containing protein [bacterium]|nr:alcohol dehydrogenase catalytic domain-containing protein [bacterium]
MRAAVARSREHLEIERIPRIEPGPGEVRVRMRACGICGSDLHMFHHGLWPPGLTPGHEITGEVDAVGDGVEGFSGGECVVVEPLRSCGDCRECRAGLDAICREMEFLGITCDGGLADYVTVPVRRLFPVPADLDPALAALAEPMAVAVHGLQRGALAEGQRVLVLGAGSVGLLTVTAALALGAGEVWISARHPHQAELAAKLGAERVFTELQASPGNLDRIGRESPIDLVVETVGGHADTMRSAVAAVRPGGAISVVGVFLGDVAFDALPVLLKETSLLWSNCYAHPREDADFETAIRLVDEGREALAAVTTHAVPLGEIGKAFALASDKKVGAVKVTVFP